MLIFPLSNLPLLLTYVRTFLKSRNVLAQFSFSISSLTGRSSTLAHYDIYASLPTSLKKEVLVRSRTDGDYDTLQRRRALVENKSPAELSQITNFSEIPLPSRIEEWLHASHDR